VASWAAEVRKVRQEAQAITRDAEKAAEALLKDARAEATHITEKATPERFLALEREVEDLKNSLRAWTAFRNLFREKVQALLGLDGSARFAADLNASWKQHPDNPDRETTTPAPRSSGPSR
jgi:cell division septum initiation protein DivIVA